MKARVESVVVNSGQGIIDLVIQEMGNIEGFISFCRFNSLAPDAQPVAGTLLKVKREDIVNDNAREFFKSQGVVVNTGYEQAPQTGERIFDESFDSSFE